MVKFKKEVIESNPRSSKEKWKTLCDGPRNLYSRLVPFKSIFLLVRQENDLINILFVWDVAARLENVGGDDRDHPGDEALHVLATLAGYLQHL